MKRLMKTRSHTFKILTLSVLLSAVSGAAAAELEVPPAADQAHGDVPAIHEPAQDSTSTEQAVPGSAFRAKAPAPGRWGFADYGPWVNVSGSSGWNRIRASSTNGRDITMQVRYTIDKKTRIDAAGGLASSVDYSFRASSGSIQVRFKVGTLGNKKTGATVTGTIQ